MKILQSSSIRKKFFFAISMVALAFIGVLLLLNLFFYDDYYLMTRRSELRTAYQSVRRAYDGNADDIAATMDILENRSAIRLAIAYENGTVLYSSSFANEGSPPSFDGFSAQQRFSAGLLPGFGMNEQQSRSISVLSAVVRNMDRQKIADSGYQFLTVSLPSTEQYLCLAGALDRQARNCLIAYMPHAVIKSNSSFNLTFLLIAGGFALLLSLLLGYYISRQFARPLTAMASVADRMSELDFSTKYEDGERSDEVGRLGQSLNRLSAYLEQAIGELQQTNDRLAQEVREKERIDNIRQEFIINVSHELKTPIALIQGYAEGLTAGIADDPEDRRYYCETIADEADRMNKLVMQLLSLSKLEVGAEQPYYEEIDLYALCEQAVHKTAVLCESRGLTVEYEDTHTTIHTDGDLLEQVLMNYLSNAIRYTANGGQIRISAARIPSGVRLHVFNQGEGLPEAELPKIWEKFYRTDRARSRENGGTGIGLSVVRAIAETLHGSCGADNVAGGIVFWFDFPYTPESSDSPPV